MRKLCSALLSILNLLAANAVAAPVNDAESAIGVAKVALQPKCGTTLNEGRPHPYVGDRRRFYATLHGGTWVVEDAPPNRRQWVNPVLRVKLDARNGAVRSITDTGE